MNARRLETATLMERVLSILREPGKLIEQREAQLKPQVQPLERNPEIARQIAGNHHRQSQEIVLRTETARVSLRPEEQKTLILPREGRRKRSRIIKRQTNAKKRVRSKSEGR